MTHFSIILLVILAALVSSTSCLAGILIGRRKRSSEKEFKYPVRDDKSETEEDVLEDEAAVYDAGKRKEEEIMERFKTLMIEKKPYLDSKVSIESVAASIGTNKTTLSKLVNERFKMNFRQLLNSYRVKEALTLFAKDQNMSIEELRLASGFKSTSTFTSSFSRFTGCTPGEYCKKVSGR